MVFSVTKVVELMLGRLQLKKYGPGHEPENLPRKKMTASEHSDKVSLSFATGDERLLVLDHLVSTCKGRS